jgi:tetratricopeptide (TPR) repeat protein
MALTAQEQADVSAQVAELAGLAEGLIQAGRAAEARDILATLDLVSPGDFAVLRLLGVALATLGDYATAVETLRRARPLRPDALVLNVLSVCLCALGDAEGALEAADGALRLNPRFAEALNNRGNALNGLERHGEAVEAFEQAVRLTPLDPTPRLNLSNALRALGRFEEALASLDQALALNPGLAVAHCNRGNILDDLGRREAAIEAYDRAIALDPGSADAHYNRCDVLQQLGRFQEAADSYVKAQDLPPPQPAAVLRRGYCFLTLGDYARGWPDYEWRFSDRGGPVAARAIDAPRWTGRESLEGRTILLHAEQGMGDAIQFVRYASLVSAMGATVTLQAHAPLLPVFSGRFGVAALVANDAPSPPVDFHCPLMSLPLALMGAGVGAEPAVPYLEIEPEAVLRWRERLAGGGPNIGLVASGNPAHLKDAERSLPLERLARALPEGPRYWLIQKELRDADRAVLPGRPDIALIGEQLADFADTAALCQALDLVISVDTSTAHLAGALGRPTWILLPRIPDWRWVYSDSETTRWYPTARLFRQAEPGDWGPVVDCVRRALSEMI